LSDEESKKQSIFEEIHLFLNYDSLQYPKNRLVNCLI